ncbi:hypothetical protein LXL04_022932 [Taraxacum kok-saghyz]
MSGIAAMDEHSNAELAVKMSRSFRIHVSNTKKPFIFYLNLAKKYIHRHHKVELTALGMAIPTVVVISEILKANGIATQKRKNTISENPLVYIKHIQSESIFRVLKTVISISTIKTKDESTGKLIQKAKIEIVMGKNDESDKPKANGITIKKRTAKSTNESLNGKDDVKNVDSVAGFVSLSLSDSSETVDSDTNLKNGKDDTMIETEVAEVKVDMKE